jgi:hypothetical protein
LEGHKREGSAEHFGTGHEKREEKRGRKRGVVVIMPLYDEGEERWREGEGAWWCGAKVLVQNLVWKDFE